MRKILVFTILCALVFTTMGTIVFANPQRQNHQPQQPLYQQQQPVMYGPQFVYPMDGQTLGYAGHYMFQVYPVAGSQGYLWGFKQNGQFVWENYSYEQQLSGTDYAIMAGTAAHNQFQPGMVEVWVRALVNNQWTDATIIRNYLQ